MSSHRPELNEEACPGGNKAMWEEPAVIRLHAGEAEGVDGTGTDTSGLNS